MKRLLPNTPACGMVPLFAGGLMGLRPANHSFTVAKPGKLNGEGHAGRRCPSSIFSGRIR